MYVVIFKAKISNLDPQYTEMVATLREKAFEKYGCVEFVAIKEGDYEIALSYWHDEASIQVWRGDCEHQIAQKLGIKNWYQSYSVEIAKISRSYQIENVK